MRLTGMATRTKDRRQRTLPGLSRPATTVREHLARQGDNEFGEFTRPRYRQ